MTTATTRSMGAVANDPTAFVRINTKVARRRLVSYSSLGDLIKDLDSIERSHRAGTLRTLGNHGAGPNFAHIAIAMKGSFDGFPSLGPLWLRLFGRALKKRVLSRPFQPGFNLRKQDEGKAWDDSVPFDDGLRKLREQIARAAKPGAAPSSPHPFFGPMSVAEWQTYYLRHAELHLSFLGL